MESSRLLPSSQEGSVWRLARMDDTRALYQVTSRSGAHTNLRLLGMERPERRAWMSHPPAMMTVADGNHGTRWSVPLFVLLVFV